jgi:hypothetical protein
MHAVMFVSSVLAAHLILTTAGFAGLIASNVWLIQLCRQQESVAVRRAVSTWRSAAQIFGPMLGAGVLLGFWAAALFRVPLTSLWLLLTYVLIVLALATQAAIMIPWQLRATEILQQGSRVSTRSVVVVLSVLSVVYVAIAGLMVVRP